MMPQFQNETVQAVFETYPPHIHNKLMQLRQLVFDVASEHKAIGQLEETLKWGQPSYLTTQTKSGSTLRIDRANKQGSQVAMYFICSTSLVDSFRQRFTNLTYEGDRAIIFDMDEDIPAEDVKECIYMTLTYHLQKKHSKH